MRKCLVILLGVFALVLLGWTWRDLYRPYRGYSGRLIYLLEPGTRASQAATMLVERGVLARRWPFLLRYWLGRPGHTLKAGEYLFDRPLRPIDVYRKLVQGDVYLYTVLIPEGADRLDMARIFHQQLGLEPEEFLRVTEQTPAIRDLDPQAATLEGYLFPDTYRFPRGVSSAAVVGVMLARFRRVLGSKFLPDLRSSGAKLHDVITLASLVEKETPTPGERPIIAGVFTRRLEKGWPLQCDPTVVYAARLNDRPVGPITERDLEFDSPYNTYRYAGLPPGPIASPGEASIRAALHPEPGDFLYFVSNNRGGHVFSRSLAEHQRNVARYQREVAALHRVAVGKENSPKQVSERERRGDRGVSATPSQSGQGGKQKATHPRTVRGAGLGTPRGAGGTRPPG
jgi:UPF0755 protein